MSLARVQVMVVLQLRIAADHGHVTLPNDVRNLLHEIAEFLKGGVRGQR